MKKQANVKPWKCENGRTYLMPEKHCVFCEHCTDIFYDYTNGPYMFLGDGCGGDYKNCNNFMEERDDGGK